MNQTNDIEIFDYRRWILHRVKFSVLLILQIPAFFLSLLIFYYFLTNHHALQIPQNRSLLILLSVNFIQITVLVTFSIHFYAVGSVNPPVPFYCTMWTFIAYTLYGMSEYLIATISVQQHMFVFNSLALRVRWRRILYHYLPLIFFLIYPPIFYTFAILVYPCDGTQWDYTSTICGFANCYLLNDRILGPFDWLVNVGSPMVINAIANALLILRVIRQKHQQRRLRWGQQRRLTLQLFCLSIIYFIGWTPSLFVGVVQILGHPTFLTEIQTDYFIELANTICLFLPWICLGFLPDLLRWIKIRCWLCRPPNRIATIRRPTQLSTRV